MSKSNNTSSTSSSTSSSGGGGGKSNDWSQVLPRARDSTIRSAFDEGGDIIQDISSLAIQISLHVDQKSSVAKDSTSAAAGASSTSSPEASSALSSEASSSSTAGATSVMVAPVAAEVIAASTSANAEDLVTVARLNISESNSFASAISAAEAESSNTSNTNNSNNSGSSSPTPSPSTSSGEVRPTIFTAENEALQGSKMANKGHHQVLETSEALVTQSDAGERQINQYLLKRVVGKGGYGVVWLSEDVNDGRLFAIKEMSKSALSKKDRALPGRPAGRGGFGRAPPGARAPPAEASSSPSAMDNIRREIAILKKLEHPNIVKLYEVLDDAKNDALFMVFEICDRGCIMDVSIESQVQPYSESDSRNIFRQLFLGMEYLHEMGIVHRDIKPDNLLFSKDYVVKIADFGISQMFEKATDSGLKSTGGSPAFMAPEICLVIQPNLIPTALDVWSMGVTLYCLVFGQLPFKADSVFKLYETIKSEEYSIPKEIDPLLADLLSKLLKKNPSERISIPEIRMHPWVTENGAKPLISKSENCAVDATDISETDIQNAFKSINMIVNVMKAITKFRHTLNQKRDIPQ